MHLRKLTLLNLLIFSFLCARAQSIYELNTSWKAKKANTVQANGQSISQPSYDLTNWMPAVVPGTVLTTLLENDSIPDPFYGMNNEQIPDIYDVGRDFYTYWFVKDFEETKPDKNGQVWLKLRGINYSCDLFLNGKKLNESTHFGMYLRQEYNITQYLKDGSNRLAVIVYPPDPVGNPNGGQGGDGRIAKAVSHQYVAGWDWIQPIRDRNTGIWDKVYIEKTGNINLKNPHFITKVPEQRFPGKAQAPATILASAELENPTSKEVKGTLQYTIDGQTSSIEATIPAKSTKEIELPDFKLENPKLWWPNGYGKQNLYEVVISFQTDNTISDADTINLGVREITTAWNSHTRSRQTFVNGQKIFIKGGNWIISDAMLRFSPERYDAEMRFHRDMNLNLMRVWGGALTERPEFYEACDKYGLMVIQDFWISGDCNGRWVDPYKAEDQWTRRQYPDDHSLFETSARDMVKMIRNHPSLAFWCGGNEIAPPQDLLVALRDDILPSLDGTRWFIEYSTSDLMSYNFLSGNGDGPYGIQPTDVFYEHRTFPFNSEVGSVGVGDIQSLRRFIPEDYMTPPVLKQVSDNKGDNPLETPNKVWDYHKYIGYGKHLLPYGAPEDGEDFARKAQLVNYDQYRSLEEGFSSHMWDWYTGVIIWKTQNPWTSMRGQMYDYYLDPNAGLYGLHHGSKPLHVMYNPYESMIKLINNGFEGEHDLMIVIKAYDMQGNDSLLVQQFADVEASSVKNLYPMEKTIKPLQADSGVFISAQILNLDKKVIDNNFYWLPDSTGNYSGLQNMPVATVDAKAQWTEEGKLTLSITNSPDNPVAFFLRASLIDKASGKRILPTFYSDNYISIPPGETQTIQMEVAPEHVENINTSVEIEGWNVEAQQVTIK